MPTLFQITAYAKLFRLLRGRRPTPREVCRYFDGMPSTSRVPRTLKMARLAKVH
ncbi:MAG: hypothetical protein ACJ8C4_07445 [Gemmataceae bacterium]